MKLNQQITDMQNLMVLIQVAESQARHMKLYIAAQMLSDAKHVCQKQLAHLVITGDQQKQ